MNLSAPEYYKLVCCSTKEELLINDEKIIFEFDGNAYNENYPDKFFNIIIGNIKTISKILINGCWLLEDASSCDKELYKILEWKSFFSEVECFECCEDCFPKEEEEKIYLRDLYVDRPKDPNYNVVKNYVSIYYRDALKRIEGIDLCCPPNKAKALIQYNIYIREKNLDILACCPPCVSLEINIPIGSIGSYSYINCEGETIVVNVNASENLTHRICVSTSSYSPITFDGTTTNEFSVIPLNISCI